MERQSSKPLYRCLGSREFTGCFCYRGQWRRLGQEPLRNAHGSYLRGANCACLASHLPLRQRHPFSIFHFLSSTPLIFLPGEDILSIDTIMHFTTTIFLALAIASSVFALPFDSQKHLPDIIASQAANRRARDEGTSQVGGPCSGEWQTILCLSSSRMLTTFVT